MPGRLLLLCLLFAATVSYAQSDSHRQAALELMEVSGSDEIINQVYDAILPSMLAMREDISMSDEERQIFDSYMQKSIDLLKEELNWTTLSPYMVDIYMRAYTEREINEMIAFYRTPTGQKVLERMPEIAGESTRIVQTIMRNITPRLEAIQVEMLEEMRSSRSQ